MPKDHGAAEAPREGDESPEDVAPVDVADHRARRRLALAVPAAIKAQEAAWIVGGLAALSRRPLPRMAREGELSPSAVGGLTLDIGFKLQEAPLRDLLDESSRQASDRWYLWVPVSGKARLVAVIAIEAGHLVIAAPGQAKTGKVQLSALDPKGRALRFVPHFPQYESELEGFGWRWLARAFFARKAVIRDILIASLMVSLVGLAFPLATQAIVDKVITNQATSTLIALGTGIAMMAVFSALMGWLRQKLLLRLSNVVDAEMSQRVMLHLLQLPLGYFIGRSTGTLINKIHGVERIRSFMAGAFLLGALDLPFMLVFLGLMVSYSVGLSAVVLGVLAAMMAVSFAAGPVLRERANEAMRLGAQVQGYVTEQVGAVETLKCLQLEPTVARQFQELNDAQLRAQLRLQEFGNGYGSFMQLAEQLMNAAVLCLGAYWAMTSTDLTIGMLVAFQMFAQRVTQPLLKLSSMWQELQQVRVSAKMLGEIVNQPIERYRGQASSAGAHKGALAVDKLSFSYAEDRPPLYENLSFTVDPGQVVLITGPSGSGKSTLAKVLLGLYPGYKGAIRLDGRDLRSMSVNEIRALFGVVPQESVLFTGTVLENLMAAAADASMERAVLACKMVGIHEAVENLPEGYQTKIGERGAGLSGGQRQRLAIARALLKRPKVLVFDEAVASLDDAAAAQVAAAVNEIRGRATVLFITHKVPNGLKIDRHLQIGREGVLPSTQKAAPAG